MQRQDEDKSGYFIPVEILQKILELPEALESAVKLSQVSCTFYNALSSAEFWRNKLIEAGLKPALFQQIQPTIAEYGYSKFYRCFLKIADKNPTNLCELITYLTRYYLYDSCYNKYGYQLFQDNIDIIRDLYRKVPLKEISGFAKQMIDIISMLIAIDAKQREDARMRFYSTFLDNSGPRH